MSIHDDYMTLTRVGPGTPMGNLLRRYWTPAFMSEQLTEPGGAPVRVRLMGENLVGFRDPLGKLGLVKENCPHRGASLAYGRNELGGLRCLYHGWKISPEGSVLETPAEPSEPTFARKICHPSYPLHEAGGLIWAYMGPAEFKPVFPRFPWLNLKPPHLLVAKIYQDTNYLQGVEGDVDPAHPNYLHRDFDVEQNASWGGAGWNSVLQLMNDGAPQIQCEETPYSFRVAAIRRSGDPKMQYVRVFEHCAPFYTYIAAGPHEPRLFKAWQPIDDNRCYTFYIHYDFKKPIDAEASYRNWGHRTSPPDYRPAQNIGNMHLQDRDSMRRNFSGIDGAAIQDIAMQEGMGPVYDRSEEHLGTSDKAVIFYRRLMLRWLRDMEAGKPLPGLDPNLDFQQRGVACDIPSDSAWGDALRWQEQYEQTIPATSAA
jgi:nitrite reductase/ring-hydroxylating ferredoxin subunit